LKEAGRIADQNEPARDGARTLCASGPAAARAADALRAGERAVPAPKLGCFAGNTRRRNPTDVANAVFGTTTITLVVS